MPKAMPAMATTEATAATAQGALEDLCVSGAGVGAVFWVGSAIVGAGVVSFVGCILLLFAYVFMIT